MAGLVPAIHVFTFRKQGVDARHKAGHDDGDVVRLGHITSVNFFAARVTPV
jgi:hypothetical protein